MGVLAEIDLVGTAAHACRDLVARPACGTASPAIVARISVAAVHADRFGADTGGTFTDVVADDGRITKVLSTPADPGAAVRDGVAALAGDAASRLLAHGTTVATNALLERRGASVALVTTEGLADVIEIARQDRPSLYDLFVDRPAPLVPRERRLEVRGRLAADGRELAPLDARRRSSRCPTRSRPSRCACCTPTSMPRPRAGGRSRAAPSGAST